MEKKLRELSEKAEPGTWELYEDTCRACRESGRTEWGIHGVGKGFHAMFAGKENAEFIVACVNYVRERLADAGGEPPSEGEKRVCKGCTQVAGYPPQHMKDCPNMGDPYLTTFQTRLRDHLREIPAASPVSPLSEEQVVLESLRDWKGGTCCENGNFDQPHVCAKQRGDLPPNIADLRQRLYQLDRLLSDPHPGLHTWALAYGKAVEHVQEFWAVERGEATALLGSDGKEEK